MRPTEVITYGDRGEARVWLNGKENVILQLRDLQANSDPAHVWLDATTWGFSTVAEWRTFLKALVRFDESLGARP